jgi:hypothetical protein
VVAETSSVLAGIFTDIGSPPAAFYGHSNVVNVISTAGCCQYIAVKMVTNTKAFSTILK